MLGSGVKRHFRSSLHLVVDWEAVRLAGGVGLTFTSLPQLPTSTSWVSVLQHIPLNNSCFRSRCLKHKAVGNSNLTMTEGGTLTFLSYCLVTF